MNPVANVDIEEFFKFYFSLSEKQYCAVLFDSAKNAGIYACLYALIQCKADYEKNIVIVSLSDTVSKVVQAYFTSICTSSYIPHTQVNNQVKIKTSVVTFANRDDELSKYAGHTDIIFNDCTMDSNDIIRCLEFTEYFDNPNQQVLCFGRYDKSDSFLKLFSTYNKISTGSDEEISMTSLLPNCEKIDSDNFHVLEVRNAH